MGRRRRRAVDGPVVDEERSEWESHFVPLARVIDCCHPLCSDPTCHTLLTLVHRTFTSIRVVRTLCTRHIYKGRIHWPTSRAGWSTGILGLGGTKTGSMCTGSGDRPPSAETDCSPVLSHPPQRASESMRCWAGVRDVSLPGNPVVRRLVGSSWLRVAGDRNLDLSRMLNCVTPGPGSRRRSDLGWMDLLQARGAGDRRSGFGIFWALF